jgi:DNA-binding XRE family transcriptional regulator
MAIEIINFENKISCKLEEYRKKTGGTKTWIAEQLGISKQSLSSLEGSDNPTLKTLIKLSYILKCDISDLYNVEIKFKNI